MPALPMTAHTLSRSRCPSRAFVASRATLSHEQAAAIGVNFVTAWCAIVEAAQVTNADTVAIYRAGRRRRRGGADRAAHWGNGDWRDAGARMNPYVDAAVDSLGDTVAQLRAASDGGASVVFDTVERPDVRNGRQNAVAWTSRSKSRRRIVVR